ncbi:MAG: (Fe-S)-binding protein [Desulfobacteraceae bacterium]|nr:(Fe-S)-binding protein [Desulfobacteraceae bacterium]
MQLTQRQIDYCMECGVCTGSCPVARTLPGFSPRQMLKRAMSDSGEDLLKSQDLWACLSCARCSVRCPVEIDFPEFTRAMREEARKAGNLPQESHHGMLQAIASLQTMGIKQQRTAWAEGAGAFKEKGEYFYFVGCLPYFDVVFEYLSLTPTETARSALALMNKMGVEPVISRDERCCGHDALWSGDESTFRKLGELNLEVINATGAKTVLFTCPEGYFTFKEHYPKYFGQLPFEVLHMTEFLARELPEAGLSFRPSPNGALTFQDPCRLGRWAGIYEPPRELLQLIPETNLVEMDRSRENSLCCGTTAWMECSGCSKTMQMERLHEAIQTGAKALITACPKCQIHLSCAQSNTDVDLKIMDLYAYLLDRLEGKESLEK